MNHQLSVETAMCMEHQRLLAECQRALEIWNEHRAEFCQFRFIGREAGDELLRLQAKYARAYTVLQNHERKCSLCQLSFATHLEHQGFADTRRRHDGQ